MSMKINVPTHEVLLKKCPRSSNEVSLSGLSSEYAPPGSMIQIGELINKLWWPVAGAQIQIPQYNKRGVGLHVPRVVICKFHGIPILKTLRWKITYKVIVRDQWCATWET